MFNDYSVTGAVKVLPHSSQMTDSYSEIHSAYSNVVQLSSQSEVILTYLLTPWCRVLLEKLTVLQQVKKFPAFHGTRRFITALTSVQSEVIGKQMYCNKT